MHPRYTFESVPTRMIMLNLPVEYITMLDTFVDQKLYANRNQAIKTAIRDLFRLHDVFCKKNWCPIVNRIKKGRINA